MIRPGYEHLRIAQIVIETRTGLSLGAGGISENEDLPVLLDACGLPTLSGSSLRGVLRALYAARIETPTEYLGEDALFGSTATGSAEGDTSLVEISFGILHDSADKPAVEPALDANGICTDPLLKELQQLYRKNSIRRRRVRIDERGASDSAGHGLFDRTVVPAGARFTFEIAMWAPDVEERNRKSDEILVKSAKAHRKSWNALLALVHDPFFRLGGGTRSGLGGITVIHMRSAGWRFRTNSKAIGEYRAAFPNIVRMQSAGGFTPVERAGSTGVNASANAFRSIQLKAEDFWRFGSKDNWLPEDAGPTKNIDGSDPDLAPSVELKIIRTQHAGRPSGATLEPHLLIAGSSIKGALRHRARFEYDRLAGSLLDADNPQPSIETKDCPAIIDLFGQVKGGNSGRIGRVLIDDVFIPIKDKLVLQGITHTAIDRFAGGVRNGFLFIEQMVWKSGFALCYYIDDSASKADGVDRDKANKAFELALVALCNGRLALGAASGRGHGRFGKVPTVGVTT